MAGDDLVFDYAIVARYVGESLRNAKKPAPPDSMLTNAITHMGVTDTIEGSSELEVTIADPDWLFVDYFDVDKDGKVETIDVNYPDGTDYWWRLTQISLSTEDGYTDITLTFMERGAVDLMHHFGPVKASRGSKTRAEFFKSLTDKVKAHGGLHFHSRELHKRQEIADAGTTPGISKGKKTVLWVGDVLAVGTIPYVASILGSQVVEASATRNRTAYDGAALVASMLNDKHEVVVFDLGSASDFVMPSPTVGIFEEVRELVAPRKMIVATLNSSVEGVDQGNVDGLNDDIRDWVDANSGQVKLVDWSVLGDPYITGDGFTPTSVGYQKRAGYFAEVIKG